jgi:alkaline phosphatase D
MSLDTATKITMSAMEAAVKARVPVMLVGSPGTGKSATVKSLANSTGYELITLVGSQADPSDIMGLPKGEKILDDDEGNPIYGTTYLSPWWQVRILKNKKVILFLDEFSNTPPATRASFLVMLQEREFPNGTTMPKETIVIGAMNASDQAADGYSLDLPTTNRIFFIPWNPSMESWCKGMLDAWGRKVTDEEKTWRGKIVRFIRENPTWLHHEPSEVSTNEAYGVNINDVNQMEVLRSAWASRRSWDNLAKVLANTGPDISIQDMIIQGLVGFSAAAAFRDWLRRNDVIDPRAVLDDPEGFDWTTMSIDDSNLVLRAVLDMIDDETSAKAIKLFTVLADADRADLGGPFIEPLFRKLISKDLSPAVIAENRKLAASLAKRYLSISKAER